MQTESKDQMNVTTLPIMAADWIAHNAATTPEKTALIDMPSNRRYSYAEVNHRVARAAAMLQSMNIGPGDRVAFLCFNTTDILEWQFATWRIGAVSVALNFRLTAAELTYIINDAEPRALLFDSDHADVVEELKHTTQVEKWIETKADGSDSPYERGLAEQDNLVLAPTVPRPLGNLAMLMYSSGTTGRPKGVMITHQMLLYSAQAITICCALTHDTVGLAVMPIFHIGAFNAFTAPLLYVGGTAVIQRMFEPGAVLKLLGDEKLRISHFLGAPAIYNALMSHPDCANTDLSRLTTGLVAAEAVPEALLHAWHARGVNLREGYGLTETTAATTIVPDGFQTQKVGSAGKPVIHCEVRVVTEDGQEAVRGTPGEIWTRGPMVTPGYWKREDANIESFVDGWFRTGDVGIMDEDGFVYITDRVKDMYISGGENVYPAEVENVLYEMDEIAEVAVIGLPHEKWGEVGRAVIVVREGATLTIEQIHAHCSGKLSRYKWPADFVTIDALPRTPSGKVQKFVLREQ